MPQPRHVNIYVLGTPFYHAMHALGELSLAPYKNALNYQHVFPTEHIQDCQCDEPFCAKWIRHSQQRSVFAIG